MKQEKVKLGFCLPGYFNFLLVTCVHVKEILNKPQIYTQSKLKT